MEIITIILLGISLSLDAFTLSLAYGLLNIPKKNIILTSISVGIFHFIMTTLGHNLGDLINKIVKINSKYVLILVLIIILIEMIKSLNEEFEEHNLNLINIIIFSLLVSFDSFSLGIGLIYITNKIILSAIIFTFLSATFTFLGFLLGKYLNKSIGKKVKIIGIILIFILLMYFICKPY